MTNNDELALNAESIITDMKRRHKDIQIYAPIMTWAAFEALLAERDADKEEIEKLRVSNRILASDAMCKQERIADMQAIVDAAEKLVRCKGRYHSEQNYRSLAALFGVKTPDLPPLETEVRELELIVPPRRCFDYAALAVQERDEQWHKALHDACKRAGIKLEVGE